MKRNYFYPFSLTLVLFIVLGCKKDANTNAGITVENLSGTYGLKALVWKSGATTVNVYDLLDDCEKDNLIKLNTDKTANFIDAGTVCAHLKMKMAHGHYLATRCILAMVPMVEK